MKSIIIKSTLLLASSCALFACSHNPPAQQQQADNVPSSAFQAVPNQEQNPTKVVKQYVPVPMPGQLISPAKDKKTNTLTKLKAVIPHPDSWDSLPPSA